MQLVPHPHSTSLWSLAKLGGLGATFRAIPGQPGWYEACWPAEYAPSGYARWACRDARDPERAYALAFKGRSLDAANRDQLVPD